MKKIAIIICFCFCLIGCSGGGSDPNPSIVDPVDVPVAKTIGNWINGTTQMEINNNGTILITSNQDCEVTGTFNATGTYALNEETGILTVSWNTSNFNCGFEGSEIIEVSMTDDNTMVWKIASDSKTWTKENDPPVVDPPVVPPVVDPTVVGSWVNGNTQVTIGNDNTIVFSSELNCGNPGTFNATGTYVMNESTGVLNISWVSSNFTCGPQVGNEFFEVSMTDDNTMVWSIDDDSKTWTRE